MIQEGTTVIEPTSGNTGIGLAFVCAALRIPLVLTMPETMSQERKLMLRAFGAELVLTPGPKGMRGAIERAEELAQKESKVFMPQQFKNPANPDAHFRTTGPEVWRQTEGKITHFVAGLGTCGTITGTGRFLKSKNPNVKVLGVYPGDGHDIPGVRSLKALKLTDFFLPKEYDGMVEIQNEEAYKVCKRLNQEESVIAGPSSGMALAGALKLVPDEPGAICVVM